MLSQQKLLRIFRLIRLLNTSPYKTVPQLATLLDVNVRSVYRYIDLLQEIGYLVDKDAQNRYFIIHAADPRKDQLLEPDEAYFIQDLIQQAASEHPLSARISGKLNKIHALIPSADSLPQLQSYQHIQTLAEAIRQGLRVQLRNYHSNSSGRIADRFVEPIHFSDDFTYLIAYDLDASEKRQFKVDRIEQVELTTQKIEFQHEAAPLDIFGFSGDHWISVRLQLSRIAYRLLLEEYPAARSFLQTQNTYYLFNGQVRDFRGIGRFILGLPGEIEVLGPPDLIHFLQQEVRRFSFLQ